MDDYYDEVNDPYMQAELAYRENFRKTAQKYGGKQQDNKNIKGFIAGIVVIIFALAGVIFSIVYGVKFFSSASAKKKAATAQQYEQLLIPVVAIDPDGFDDISAAPMKELVHIAVWSIIGSDLDSGKYSYVDDELVIPAEDVEKAFVSFFGSQRAIEHLSVDGYGYEFKYDAEKNVYLIPLTTINPVYTPRVTSVDIKGGATVITCGLINSNIWMQDHKTGDIFSPEPDKFIKVTLRESGGMRYISSIQSSGTPEIAVPEANNSPSEQTSQETTEEETIMITRN